MKKNSSSECSRKRLNSRVYSIILLNDILERCTVIERDVHHLLNTSNFVKDYFYIDKTKDAARETKISKSISREGRNSPEGKEGGGKIFRNYHRILDLMYRDIYRIMELIKTILDRIDECNSAKAFNDPSCCNIIWEALKIYCTENYCEDTNKDGSEISDDSLFEEFRKVRVYKKWKKFDIEDYLTLSLVVRTALERQKARPYELSLSILNLALRGVRYSLDQAMRGCFVGHMVEQEPIAYTHRDLYHVIRYLTMYCNWYCKSMINFTNYILSSEIRGYNSIIREIKKFFCKLTGVELNGKSDNEFTYIVVFGDRNFPTLIERYRLISLPIVCAYRPRYWAAVSHEVAHTFVNGLLYLKWAFDDLNDEFYKLDLPVEKKTTKILNDTKFRNFVNLLNDTTISVRKLEKWDLIHPSSDNANRWLEQYVSTEILADIFAFLLSGHAYLQTASDLLAERIFPIVDNKVVFLIRIYAIYEFAYSILEKYSIKKSLDYISKIIKENKNSKTPLKKSLETGALSSLIIDFDNIIENYSERELVEWYKRLYLDNYDLVNNLHNKVWIRKFCKLGKTIGYRIYQSFKDEGLLDGLSSLNYFGWLCDSDLDLGSNINWEKVFSIVLNLILNKNVFDRYSLISKYSGDNSLIRTELTFETESFKMFKYIKSMEWVEKTLKSK